jgi:hypothetical protein
MVEVVGSRRFMRIILLLLHWVVSCDRISACDNPFEIYNGYCKNLEVLPSRLTYTAKSMCNLELDW